MLRVVLDTTVVVSAAIRADGAPALLLALALEGSLRLFVSPDLLAEYEAVLKRERFGLRPKDVSALVKKIRKKSTLVRPKKRVRRIKEDDSDNRILECALEAKADYVVTGDKKHFPFDAFRGIKVASPRDLVIKLGDEIK